MPQSSASSTQSATHRPRRRPHRRPAPLTCLALLGLALFLLGFLLGRLTAPKKTVAAQPTAAPAPVSSPAGAETAQPPASAPAEETEPSANAPAEEPVEWNMVLVNFENPISEEFVVPPLTEVRSGQKVDSRIYAALKAMLDDARAAGMDPLVCSSYRSLDVQENLYSSKVDSYLNQGKGQAEAEQAAAMWVARPGTSEHHTGLAVDIVSLSYQLLDEAQAKTETQKWLMEHCAEYGFILRYPTEKSELTGVHFEPWHYRYVGKEAAREITDRGICFEEYVAQLGM